MNKQEYAEYLKSEHWQQVRSAFKKTPAYGRCFLCRSNKKLQIHHRTYERIGAELMSDLLCLCDKCHGKVHAVERYNKNVSLWDAAHFMKRTRNAKKKSSKNKNGVGKKQRCKTPRKMKLYEVLENIRSMEFVVGWSVSDRLRTKHKVIVLETTSPVRLRSYMDELSDYTSKME